MISTSSCQCDNDNSGALAKTYFLYNSEFLCTQNDSSRRHNLLTFSDLTTVIRIGKTRDAMPSERIVK